MTSRILVTGAAGFIGNAVASRLIERGDDVLPVDDFSSGRNRSVAGDVPVMMCDVRDVEQLRSVISGSVSAIIHCAAQSSGEVSFDDPWDDMSRHVHATIRLLEAAVEFRIPRFVYTSSMAAYGQPVNLPVAESTRLEPLSFYGAGKAAAENYVRLFKRFGIESTILRPFSVYGSGQDLTNLRQGMISIYLAQLARDGRIVVKGSLDRFRDFVHVDDAVSAIEATLEHGESVGETLNLCSGRPTTVHKIIDTLLRIAGKGWDCVEVTEGTPGDQFGMYGDNTRLKELTGWSITKDIEAGIGDMWLRACEDSDVKRGRDHA